MASTLDYQKMPSDKRVGLWLGPSGTATGIQNAAVPTAAEINNTGGTSAMLNVVRAVSWSDTDFAITEAETSSDPSLADESTYEDLGPAQYGGGISFFYPGKYDDPTNTLSNAYDLTDLPWEEIDIVQRIDGDKINPTAPAANGDFVHVFRTWIDGESNVLEADTAYRRTVGFKQAGEASFYTIVGAHTITAIAPSAWTAGSKGRLRASVQSRDYTNALTFTSSDASVVEIYPGGFYKVTGVATDTATITIEDEAAGTSTTVNVTVA